MTDKIDRFYLADSRGIDKEKISGPATFAAIIIILGTIAYLAITGANSNKSYYVTIRKMKVMGNKVYTRNLRVAGNVVPGSIERSGTNSKFILVEQRNQLEVSYAGSEPPPDTFKNNAQALAIGTLGRDGTFQATQLQAKCASKYASVNKSGSADTTATLKTAVSSSSGN